jgi:hypothetical protein
MAQKTLRKLLLSLSVTAVLTCSWSGSVFADGDKVEALEARVAELEALVHQLLQKQDATNEALEAVAAESVVMDAVEVATEAKVIEMMEEHQQAEAEKVHKHSYKFGGYVKADVLYSDYSSGSVAAGNVGRDFYIPFTVPTGPEDASGESYLDFHAKESRINFKSTHLLDNGSKLGTFIEMDFLLSGQGNELVSNSYSPRLRHAFITYDKWLFGQTWMTFFNVGALPENLDFVGPTESTIFGRQPMIRYTSGGLQLAVENPETRVTTYGGGGSITADDNTLPDAVARYNWKGDWGAFTVAGILRQMRIDNNASDIDDLIKDTTTGYGVSVSGKFKVGAKDDFRWMASAGGGMGRYFGILLSNGAVLDEDGKLHVIDSAGAFGSFRHFWNDKWRSNLTLGYSKVDNDTELTGMKATKKASSVHVNLIYNPLPKLDFGIEFMMADRELENGDDGDLKRLQFSAKYGF